MPLYLDARDTHGSCKQSGRSVASASHCEMVPRQVEVGIQWLMIRRNPRCHSLGSCLDSSIRLSLPWPPAASSLTCVAVGHGTSGNTAKGGSWRGLAVWSRRSVRPVIALLLAVLPDDQVVIQCISCLEDLERRNDPLMTSEST